MAHATNRCPVGDCPARLACEQLMCSRHWQLVPGSLKRALRRARTAAGPGSREHQQAIRACIDSAQASCEPACDGDLRRMARRFLAGYRTPNAINGETWDEEDVTRMIRVMRCHPHKPDPRTRRCRLCGAVLGS
ncbi:MAG: hypothetical protein ACRDMJ_07510 [Solirubrobacteraceae bacterium]